MIPPVDIFTDASVKHKRGAWGAVIIQPGRKKETCSGVFKQPVKSTTEAELYATANAITKAASLGFLSAEASLTVFCDNDSAVRLLNGWTAKRVSERSHRYALAVDHVRAVLADSGATAAFEWIKGHQPRSIRMDATLRLRIGWQHESDRLAKEARELWEWDQAGPRRAQTKRIMELISKRGAIV